MAETSMRRTELGQFLKKCRARVGPADVGLPPGERRRTAGLRREEVAMLANVGVTWYTWLEQGREINASSQVLDAVARTLRMDQAERRHLYQLAEATPVRFWDSYQDMPPAVLDVLTALEPQPAVIVNGLYDVLASNKAHEYLYWDWHSMGCVHKNLLWCCVTEPKARQLMVTYDRDVPHMVARMRSLYARHIGDPEWEENIRRLSETNEEFAALWERREVADPAGHEMVLELPEWGRLTFAVSELTVAACPNLRIQVDTAADERTKAAIEAVMVRGRPDQLPG